MTITIEDLVEPKRASGYRYVVRADQREGWAARGGTRPHFTGEPTSWWHAGTHATPEAAAQAACDHLNGVTTVYGAALENDRANAPEPQRAKPKRRLHLPDINDRGAHSGQVSGSAERSQRHLDYVNALIAKGLLGDYDDAKLEDVRPRDLAGTAHLMYLDAFEEDHPLGRILVPAPLTHVWGETVAASVKYFFGIDLIVVPV